MDKKMSYWRVANHVGLFFVALFVLCFAWFHLNPAERELHEQLFQLSYLGLSGMGFMTFVLGAVQSYIWGYIVVGIWKGVALLSGCCHHKCCSK